jgi:AcrR family transcriptional regulator
MSIQSKRINVELVRKLYREGELDVSAICQTAGISRAAFYYHYNRDKGTWDKEREEYSRLELAKAQDTRDLEIRHNQMLALFISQMEARFEELNNLGTIDALDKLKDYINLYHSIKNPKKGIKADRIAGAQEALRVIAELAAGDKDKPVGRFLRDHADQIVERIARVG